MSDCIIGANIVSNGYAKVGRKYEHRIVWEKVNGPIPPDYQIHHTCGTKACINIEHLQLMSSMAEHQREHRTCPHGDEDRYVRPGSGKTECRICRREHQRRIYWETEAKWRKRRSPLSSEETQRVIALIKKKGVMK